MNGKTLSYFMFDKWGQMLSSLISTYNKDLKRNTRYSLYMGGFKYIVLENEGPLSHKGWKPLLQIFKPRCYWTTFEIATVIQVVIFWQCIINAWTEGHDDITMTLPVNRYGNQGENGGWDWYALDHSTHFADHASKRPAWGEDRDHILRDDPG